MPLSNLESSTVILSTTRNLNLWRAVLNMALSNVVSMELKMAIFQLSIPLSELKQLCNIIITFTFKT